MRQDVFHGMAPCSQIFSGDLHSSSVVDFTACCVNVKPFDILSLSYRQQGIDQPVKDFKRWVENIISPIEPVGDCVQVDRKILDVFPIEWNAVDWRR